MTETIKNIVVIFVFSMTLAFVYILGYSKGYDKVYVRWTQEQNQARSIHEERLIDLATQLESHRQKQQDNALALKQARELHEAIIIEQRGTYEQRLLQAERRAAIYQRQAQDGAAARRNLASHAAELDRALEEGIHLVGELESTLRLRDRQVIQLGNQLLSDRKLLEDSL